jgi:hypothetical protein
MTWLTVMEYMCYKRLRICSTFRKHFPLLSTFKTYYRVYTYINTTGVTSGVRVTWSLVLCVCISDRCLSFCTFCGHCFVCPSSIYWYWLSLCYLQTLLKHPRLLVRLIFVVFCCWYITHFGYFNTTFKNQHNYQTTLYYTF